MTIHDHTSIAPVRPIAPWLGGKRNLAKRICALIDRDDHLSYAEPFVGMGGIFLRRTRCPRAEFINDRGRDVYNLFRVLQEHYVAFLDLLRFQITTQANLAAMMTLTPPNRNAATNGAYTSPRAAGMNWKAGPVLIRLRPS